MHKVHTHIHGLTDGDPRLGLKYKISRSDPGARRDCEAGEADVGAAPASADAGPAQPQQGEARQGERCHQCGGSPL